MASKQQLTKEERGLQLAERVVPEPEGELGFGKRSLAGWKNQVVRVFTWVGVGHRHKAPGGDLWVFKAPRA